MPGICPDRGLTRRQFLAALGTTALAPTLPAAAATGAGSDMRPRSQSFALSQVRLGDGVFAHSSELNVRYLAALDVDRLLAPFRMEAGLPSPASRYPNWESMGLDGHTAGHYLSALAQQAAQGDVAMAQRLDAMVDGLARCQQAHGDGYVGALPGGRTLWDRIASGDFQAEGFALEGAWVPFYNLHKTFAGLRDAWLMTGHAQARKVLVGFADWAGRLVAGLDDAQLQRMLDTEHGGMNEVLADVYAITGQRRYLALARRFSHRAILDPLLRGEDRLDGLHANTQIPKVIGFARIGELDGDPAWIKAAQFFWNTVTRHRSIAFGGNSVREHFNPSGDFSSMVQSREGPETCNSYNMLRLTLLLHRLDPQPHYADFYERTLYNHILSTQHPVHGGLVYFTPARPRHYRVYSQPHECFWCCVGSGMENHGRHAAFAYTHDDDRLRVNLYMASRLTWPAHRLVLHQETHFPEQPRSRLRLQLERPRTFELLLRHPHWLDGPLQVRVNGRPQALLSTPSSYAGIRRRWRDGDTVDVELPLGTRVETLPGSADWVAVMHGPLMLAARTGTEDMPGLVADDGRGSHIAPGPYQPLDQAPMLVGEPRSLAEGIVPVPGQPLVFDASALVRPAHFRSLRLEPLHRIHDARYMSYWRTTSEAGYPGVVAALGEAERQRQALEARTLDQVQPGEQQPEVDHAYRGRDSAVGTLMGRPWRDAAGSFSYLLAATDGTADDRPLMLQVTLFGGEWRAAMDVQVEGRVAGTVAFDGSDADDFTDREFVLPVELSARARQGGVRVAFVARDGQRTPRVFGVRLLRPVAAP